MNALSRPPAPLLTLIPPVAVGAVWWMSHEWYHTAVPCTSRPGGWGCGSSLRALTEAIGGLKLPGGPILAAYDVAGRLAWQSTLVVFLAVASLVGVICAYLAYRAMQESGVRGATGLMAVLVVLALTVSTQAALNPRDNLLLTDMLVPLIDAAFAQEPFLKKLIGETQSLFKGAAFMASSIVVMAAGTALLKNAGGSGIGEKEHLVNQWRRLKHALFAGAALLVSAVLFQAAFFGWAHSLTEAVTAEIEQEQLVALSRVALARAAMEPQEVEYAAARSGLAAELNRRAADTLSAAALQQLLPLRRVLDATAARYRPDSVRVDSLMRALPADTAGIRIAAVPVAAAAARIDQLTTAGITQAGGLVYSVLLLVMYLPAALILLERARDLSLVHATGSTGQPARTEKEREQWRADNQIGFTFWSEWTKALAVLAPALSSIPAAKLILDLFKP